MKHFLQFFLGLILPLKCIKCHIHIYNNAILCHQCWKNADFISEPFCSICSTPLQYSFNIPKHLQICGECQRQKPLFDRLLSFFKYTDDIKQIIFKYKYQDKVYLAKKLGHLINQTLQQYIKNPKFDFVIPVPLHKKKLRQRMYNQSALLAKYIATQNNLCFFPEALIRTKHTPSQIHYTKKMRAKNVLGAFVLNKKYHQILKNKNILLVDDVVTTGATINECCKVLRKNHCNAITVLTVAKRVL